MIRGVYRAAATMLSEMLREDVHANNLANVDTTGFKRCLARVMPTGANGNNVIVGGVDLTAGDLKLTESPLDVALRTAGYFVTTSAAGRQYTRNGHFSLDSNGMLIDSQGAQVLGANGPIRLTGSRIEITGEGAVYSDGARVDRLLVVDFPAQSEVDRAAGATVVANRTPTAVASPTIVQGALEGSNVNPVLEMTAMHSGFRIYEANARTINQLDRTLAKLVEATTN